MEKHFIELQLFAEDGAGEPAADTQAAETKAEKATEPEKKEKKAEEPKNKYSDEDVDKIISKKFAEWEKKKQKEVDEAQKLAEMNAQQKAEYERDQLRKELDALKKKDSLSEMTKTARKMLADEDITISDELLAVMVTTDAEKTKAAVDGFATLFKEAVESAVKERLKGAPPKKGSAGGPAVMTKEQIMAIKDPEQRQKKMLENRDLFNF